MASIFGNAQPQPPANNQDAASANTSSASPDRIIEIEANGDLIFKLKEVAEELSAGFRNQEAVYKQFRVSREVMIRSSPSFKAMLTGPFKEGNEDVVELVEESAVAMELWLRCLHQDNVTELMDISIDDVWQTIRIGNARMFPPPKWAKLTEWFGPYCDSLLKRPGGTSFLLACKLLYPCYLFDHAKGFARASLHMVFDSDKIEELNPTEDDRLQCPSYVLGALKAARLSMRNKLANALSDIEDSIAQQSQCAVTGETILAFRRAVIGTGSWPLHRQHDSIANLLTGFDNFSYARPQGDNCRTCNFDYNKEVANLVKNIRFGFWNGLCIDCCKPDREYRRMRHNDNTTHFSLLARYEVKSITDLTDAQREAYHQRKKAGKI